MEIILWLLIMLIPAVASFNVKHTFKKYSSEGNSRWITAENAARKILDISGLENVKIDSIHGELTDHYDPTTERIALSEQVYGHMSIAAVGVAAHECGHAIQHRNGYGPLMLREKLVPATNFCARGSYILILIGAMMGYNKTLIDIGIFLFIFVLLFHFITLPVELDASRRAIATLGTMDLLGEDELNRARKVLTAAAWTYVASTFSMVLTLTRLILLSRASGRRRR